MSTRGLTIFFLLYVIKFSWRVHLATLINPVEDNTLLNPNDDFIINHRGVKWRLFRSQIALEGVSAHPFSII